MLLFWKMNTTKTSEWWSRNIHKCIHVCWRKYDAGVRGLKLYYSHIGWLVGVAQSHFEAHIVCTYDYVDRITLHAKGLFVILYAPHISIWSKLYNKYICKQIFTKTHWVKETKSWSGKPNHGQNKYKVTARRDPLPACVCFVWFIYSFWICVFLHLNLFLFNFFQSNLSHFCLFSDFHF